MYCQRIRNKCVVHRQSFSGIEDLWGMTIYHISINICQFIATSLVFVLKVLIAYYLTDVNHNYKIEYPMNINTKFSGAKLST